MPIAYYAQHTIFAHHDLTIRSVYFVCGSSTPLGDMSVFLTMTLQAVSSTSRDWTTNTKQNSCTMMKTLALTVSGPSVRRASQDLRFRIVGVQG